MILHLNKLEFPSHKDTMCQVKLKLAQWCERRRYNFTVSLVSPLGKWHDPLNAKNLIEYKQDRTEYMIGLICQVNIAGDVRLTKGFKDKGFL